MTWGLYTGKSAQVHAMPVSIIVNGLQKKVMTPKPRTAQLRSMLAVDIQGTPRRFALRRRQQYPSSLHLVPPQVTLAVALVRLRVGPLGRLRQPVRILRAHLQPLPKLQPRLQLLQISQMEVNWRVPSLGLCWRRSLYRASY